MGVCVKESKGGETARLKEPGGGEGSQLPGIPSARAETGLPTVPGLVKPAAAPSQESAPGPAHSRWGGGGRANHPETEPRLVWEWGFR